MYKKIYDFNQVRNQFKYDADLEIAMYNEEKKEFFDAITLAERVDAYCDCGYVEQGTYMKMAMASVNTPPYTLCDNLMFEIIDSEIAGWQSHHSRSRCGDGKTQLILDKAMKIVCECNELKLQSLDENGKVNKGDIPNATVLIAEMIEKVMED